MRPFVVGLPLALMLGGLLGEWLGGPAYFTALQNLVDQLIDHLGWLFDWSTFLFVILVMAIYVSPLGRVRIGGKNATPIVRKWRWFAITLCTTIATGILFWGTAEPIFHLRDYPLAGETDPTFALSTLFLHWTITPYAIYTIAGLAFALGYYNRGRAFSLWAMLFPFTGSENRTSRWAALVDSVCLYGLMAGMAASLGAGVLTLTGGLRRLQWIKPDAEPFGLICTVIVLAFVFSAGSGLQRGIRWLSGLNFLGFVGLAIVVFAFAPLGDLFELTARAFADFVRHFPSRSTSLGDELPAAWRADWTTFYWANWYAWAPITGLFLGRLAVGYTVREFITVNWLMTSLFGAFWMIVFGGSSILLDGTSGGSLQRLLTESGAESIVFALLGSLPLAPFLVLFFVVLVFLSYVTAADSNVSAMSALSVTGVRPDQPEASLWIKVGWGVLIGLIAWVLIRDGSLDGIRLISILGGLPAMLLICGVSIGLLREIFRK